jgi:putative alpha-1,2-mannosidase
LIQIAGRETFNTRLEEGFAKGYVDLSNEPNLQAPFLFNYSGKPWLTQQYSRLSAAGLFRAVALYRLGGRGRRRPDERLLMFCSSMGLFEMDGGCAIRPFYDLSSPLFDRVVHSPGSGNTIPAKPSPSKPGTTPRPIFISSPPRSTAIR